MLVTPSGIVMLVRLSQYPKVPVPMLVMVGRVIFVRLSQSKKADSSILVTLLGMIILVRLSQSKKADFPMVVTVLL